MAETNVAVQSWLQRFAPDFTATVQRFPFAVVLAALATAAFLIGAHYADWYTQWIGHEGWLRLFLGLATAAVLAVAGVFFAESRPAAKRTAFLLTYLLPVVVAAACLLRDWGDVVPFVLPPAAILWLSVSPVTRIGKGAAREEQQNRFWWINERAIASAALAGLAFCVIALGVVAIERSLDVLFGLSTGEAFYRWVLPFTGLFLTPVYWLSTLPRLDEYEAGDLERPDFVAGSVGALGNFVLVPFLALYAAILLIYAGQIAIVQQLPEGMIGWMVLGFVVAGAGTWLVLHPPFMRGKPLARLFRRWWWWMTLVPLTLFFVAVWIRIDAYGLTSERMLLVTGGAWATILAAVFLAGRGDIRLIPGLAGGILAVFSIGPWSYFGWPNSDQGSRLSGLLAIKADPTATVSSPNWTPAQEEDAKSAIFYLDATPNGQRTLSRVLLDHGFIYDPAVDNAYDFLADIGYSMTAPVGGEVVHASRGLSVPIDVSATPFYVGHQDAWEVAPSGTGFEVSLKQGALEVYRDGTLILSQPLGDWAGRQGEGGVMVEPWIDFSVEGVRYRFTVTNVSWRDDPEREGEPREVKGISGLLFADSGTVAIPRP